MDLPLYNDPIPIPTFRTLGWVQFPDLEATAIDLRGVDTSSSDVELRHRSFIGQYAGR